MASAGRLASGRLRGVDLPAREIRFRNVTFAYPGGGKVLDGFDLAIPAGSSLAIVGQNGAGKTTLAKLLCRLYDPQDGAIEVDGVDLRDLDLTAWRSRPLESVWRRWCRRPQRMRYRDHATGTTGIRRRERRCAVVAPSTPRSGDR